MSTNQSDSGASLAARHARSARRYSRCFLAVTFGVLAAVGALNIIVDPFWIHRGPWSSYWRPVMKQASSRIAKGEIAARDRIDVALIGDSRMLSGLDPEHPVLTRLGHTYNFGMTSTTVEEATRVLELLLHQNRHQPKLVLWIIQPEFLVYDRRPKHQFDYRLSRLNPAEDPASRWLNSIWSREATSRTVDLFRFRRETGNSLVLGSDRLFSREPTGDLKSFQKACRDLRKSYLQTSSIPSGVEMEKPVGRIFQECAHRGIQLEVIIPPSHAMYWECLKQIGWYDRVELGKRSLVQLAESACLGQRAPRNATPPVRVWDFSGFDGPAAEPIPNENSPLQWHCDPVHFTRKLGDRIINRVTGEPGIEPDFGTLLTTEALEMHITAWRRDLDRYSSDDHQRLQYVLKDSDAARH